MKSAQIEKDKFESLCHVRADISSAPYTSQLGKSGKIGYKREYTIILLVGLTELKAQVGWIDSETVRGISFNLHASHLIRSLYARIQGTEKRFVATLSEIVFPRLNPTFRSDAVVIYNPSGRA